MWFRLFGVELKDDDSFIRKKSFSSEQFSQNQNELKLDDEHQADNFMLSLNAAFKLEEQDDKIV